MPLFVKLFPVPLPTGLWLPQSGGALKELDVALQLPIIPRQVFEVLTNLLVQALAHSPQPLPRAFCDLFVDGQSDIHEHSICAHVIRVNLSRSPVSPYLQKHSI